MISETDIDTTAVLNGVIALLATAGLSDDQIGAVTGRDPRPVRALLDAPARKDSVLDRARMTLSARP
jgi:hypothetical protein